MAINKKLIHFKKYETFIGSQGINGATSPRDGYYGNIPETSIVFIQDVRQIWTHGLLYDCDYNLDAVLTSADERYKKIQTIVSSPTASTTTSTTFIDTISQDAQGKITATKKTLPAGASCIGTVTSVKVGTTSYSPSSGVVSLPAYPTAVAKLSTARTISLDTGITGTATSFDGSKNITIPVTSIKEAYLEWGGTNISGDVSPIDAASSSLHSANRFALANPNGITVEYSTDGTSWTNYNDSNEVKVNLVSGLGASYYIGKRNSNNSINDKLRITLNATSMSVYTRLRKLLINISTNYSVGSNVTIEKAMKGSETTFSTIGTYNISGWSGWNSFPINKAFGGGNTQTSNIAVLRLTFGITGINSDTTKCSALLVLDIIAIGDTYWTHPSTLAKTGHLYNYDYIGNASFPANVTATTFIGALSGNAASATKATKDGSGNVITTTYATTIALNNLGDSFNTFKGTIKTVATTGSYNDLTNKPTIPTNTNLLTNGAGFITGITKAMVTTALGYTPPTSNTWRDIYVKGTKYSGSAIDFAAGSNVSLTLGTADSGGKQTLTIAATNTTNTAGSSNKTGTKLLLVGATSTTTGLTYTNSNCYIGTDNCLYSGGTKVLTSHQSLSGYLTSTTAASTYLAKAGGTTTGLINLNGATYNDTLKISNKDYATAYAQIFMGGGDDFVIRQVLVSTGATTDLRFNGTRLSYTKDLSIGGAATITGAISAQGAKFYTNANGVYWTSDRKFKDCIKSPVKNGMLDDETGLIRKFNWKDTGKASCGFIAQELLPYVPEAVDYDKELNKYSVNYDVAHSALLGLLVIKIKELESEIKSLKSKIN